MTQMYMKQKMENDRLKSIHEQAMTQPDYKIIEKQVNRIVAKKEAKNLEIIDQ